MGDNYCTIWKKTETKAKMLKIMEHYYFSIVFDDTLLKIKEGSGVITNPNLIITDFMQIEALIKITADDPNLEVDIKNSDIENYINGIILVRFGSPSDIDEKDILHLEDEGRPLPLKKSTIVILQSNEKVLRISCLINSNWYKAKIKMTPEIARVGEIMFTFEMDENYIFSYNYSIIETLENTERREIYDIPQKKLLVNNPNVNAVGIDLGMTRCAVAVNRTNGFELVAIDNREKQLPSYISFKEADPICGQLVIDHLQFYANSTIFDTKRLIGKNFEEIQINPIWPFEVIKKDKNNKKPMIQVQGFDAILQKFPEEILSILLKHIKLKAEEFQGRVMDEVVITIPAGFNQSQKIATHVAAELAGWKIVHLLAEPIAATIAYFVDRPIPSSFNMLLFDLGGGTLDLCIFKVEKNKLKIATNNGDSNFGGRDFDDILFEHFSKILQTNYKISVYDVGDFNCEIDEFVEITRQEFEKMCVPLLKRIQEILTQTLSETEFHSTCINKILLVGGGCRMPMIQHFLRQTFTAAEHTCEKNPDEMVAIGAAYYASFIMSKNDKAACNIM
uniref:Heat shock protein 70 n=1 Tax=Panagrolaimus davidi TaxID=227884 RepID=A0A914QDL6_9BILA